MTTTHLCLLSEQPIPNLVPLLDARLKASKVVFLVSPQQQDALSRMKTVLGPKGIAVEAINIADAMDYQGIVRTLDEFLAARKISGETLLINATGGTKPMSIAAHMAGFNASIPVFYVQNDHVHWLEHEGDPRDEFDLEEKLKLKEYINAHGFTLNSRKTHPVPLGHLDLFKDMVAKPSYHGQIKTLNFLAWQAAKSGLSARLDANHQQSQALQALFDRLEAESLIDTQRDSIHFTSEANRDLCNGLWLEELCYKEAEKLKGTLGGKLQDVGRSLQISGQGKGREPVDNELDLALLYDNRFFLVECKTRNFTDKGDPDVESALYKLVTLRRNVGGLYGKGMLVSAYPVADKHKRRAAALDIAICDGASGVANIQSCLKNWLTRPGITR